MLPLPFNQDKETLKQFDFLHWRFYVNRAKLDGRCWITKNSIKGTRFVHRVTTRIRSKRGVKYLQLICFSWWVAIIRKDEGQFSL